MILYSIGRFFIEIYRNDFRGEWGGLSTSQLISIIVLISGISFMYLLKRIKESCNLNKFRTKTDSKYGCCLRFPRKRHPYFC
ncbi:hypothetical protein C823_008001 [Eubacterium plexicaudatum ASF492]|nr:hypothetical protein C823_008001 [Eubacterium plexicaudatum ASF492]